MAVKRPYTCAVLGAWSRTLGLFRHRSAEEKEAALVAARLAAIVESSDDAIVGKALDGTVWTWNAAAERIFGYPADEIVGSSIYRLIPPELHDQEREILSRVGRGERVEHYETTRIRKDGNRIPIDLTVSPVRDTDDSIIGASSFSRDITERKRASEAAARLAALVESSADAIISKNLDGTVASWNTGAEQMYGYSADEMVGRPIYTIIPEELAQEERDIMDRVAAGGRVAHYETIRRRRDGAQLNISLSISPIRDGAGNVIGASSIQRDVTERKRVEESLRQSAKMEAIGALAGGLAHDFNNQLHALSGFAHFVARDPGLGAAGRQDLMEIQKTTERMASLTRQLLAFARQQTLSPETLDLNSALEDARPMLQRLIGSNMEIHLDQAPGPKWVRVDRSQLVQILLNLVINARDAMPAGGRLVLRTETLEVSPAQLFDRMGMPLEPGAYAELAVADSGQGIGPEHLSHIFEPFYTTKTVGQGTGLGLATVDGIVSQSGGRIQVESMPGRGTTIRILLPLTGEPAPEPPLGSLSPARRRQRARILVVDDEDSVRAVVARTLQTEGYEVLGARHGTEALAYIEEVGGSIDLVIVDLVMPVMGGQELTAELARRYPDLPVIWMSGHPRPVEVQHPEADEEPPFLQKPVPHLVLVDTVVRVLEREANSL
ncbi:MAG: PAS domain-containing hybrid sensor histidine kinase/response regulator [Gemmatimonadales bacterium]